ncbi:MAG TPA: M20/M25/M40 family metallo-hydrolase, partial [Deinococcales bacterium]|nr:M20/M25/M40 family metallo-hydrolase [Deinococcales bacterium]
AKAGWIEGPSSGGPESRPDTQCVYPVKTAFLYAPSRVRGFRGTFVLSAVLAGLSLPLVLAGWAWAPLRWAGGVLAVYFLANAALFVWRELRAPFVNGANDNATGVAAAVAAFEDLAATPGAGRVTLLLTGCEEVGARGARAFLRAHPEATANLVLDVDLETGSLKIAGPAGVPGPTGTLVINLDNVGRGTVHLATGEGMLRYFPYRREGIEAAREAARTLGVNLPEVEYRLAYFDALPFVQARDRVVTFIALEDGIIPNWHWRTDVLDNVDPAVPERAAELAVETARAFLAAGHVPANAPVSPAARPAGV